MPQPAMNTERSVNAENTLQVARRQKAILYFILANLVLVMGYIAIGIVVPPN